jgi:hypothetical protein
MNCSLLVSAGKLPVVVEVKLCSIVLVHCFRSARAFTLQSTVTHPAPLPFGLMEPIDLLTESPPSVLLPSAFRRASCAPGGSTNAGRASKTFGTSYATSGSFSSCSPVALLHRLMAISASTGESGGVAASSPDVVFVNVNDGRRSNAGRGARSTATLIVLYDKEDERRYANQ